MASVQERLRAAGLRLFDGERPEVRPELARIAGILQRRGCRTVGLLPAADDVGVPAVALEAGLALAEVTARPTGVVDAQGTWLDPPPGPEERADVFSVAWLTERLALLTPRPVSVGSTFRAIEAGLREETRGMAHLVVDLTGLERSGEHLEAIAVLDAIAVVAHAGRTTSLQLARWMPDIPADKNLGVLLVGV